ncbi:MAG: hypothetical protein PHH52_02730, partial [Patescibacteria group bacterium]|nr:hypothetical protein [Patescibacteria group bacterium]
MIEAIKKLVIKAIKQAKNRDDLEIIKREFCKTYKLSAITNAQILKTYKELVNKHKVNKSQSFEKLLRKRSIRTLSRIAPVAVLTKFYPCPGNCAY